LSTWYWLHTAELHSVILPNRTSSASPSAATQTGYGQWLAEVKYFPSTGFGDIIQQGVFWLISLPG
jgi:hypothetical protein